MEPTGTISSTEHFARIPASFPDGTSNTLLATEKYAQCFNNNYPTGGSYWGYYFTGMGLQPYHPGIEISWMQWLTGFLPVGAPLLLLLPYLVYRIYPPEIRSSADVRTWAGAELGRMGRFTRQEAVMALLGVVAVLLMAIAGTIVVRRNKLPARQPYLIRLHFYMGLSFLAFFTLPGILADLRVIPSMLGLGTAAELLFSFFLLRWWERQSQELAAAEKAGGARL